MTGNGLICVDIDKARDETGRACQPEKLTSRHALPTTSIHELRLSIKELVHPIWDLTNPKIHHGGCDHVQLPPAEHSSPAT
jgi:hypothetical protein